jgi:1,4-alpha-glucan branching enzyme
MLIPDFVKRDKYLLPHNDTIVGRMRKAYHKERELTDKTGSLSAFALGHMHYGLHREADRWVYRDWAPNAQKIYFLGAFSDWKLDEHFVLQSLGNGNWEISLPHDMLQHGDLYKLYMCWEGGSGDRIPAWSQRVVQDRGSQVFNAQVWDPPEPYSWKNKNPVGNVYTPFIYEAHIGMATESYEVATWEAFRTNVLPDVERAGYNTIQLMAVQEHPYYGSFGYHVSNFFSASSRFGTPEELKALIDDAHGRGIRVIMDIVHSHAVRNEVEGISKYDGTYYQYFHDGQRGSHMAWDSRCFDYGKNEVLHFLLSNCKFWLDEYRFDGFRFDGVTSMLYLDHGLGSDFSSYEQYFNLNQDEDAIVYLYLANKLIHELNPAAVTIAEEMSGMPGLATPQGLGGIGFDYRLAMGVPDFWVRTIKEKKVESWHVGEIFHQISNKRQDEKTIHYAESHDQALVGDKTLIFWLMDKDMYFDMHVNSTNLIVDNGMALHKMIRLITLAAAGNGYLNFMGNEFGHPEWIDFPGAHNNWSYHYARRQWSLRDNPDLKFKYLAAFDRAMIGLFKNENILQSGHFEALFEHAADQVIAFFRAGHLCVFNFSPFHSYSDYAIPVRAGTYNIVMDTDAAMFGGFGRIDHALDYPSHEEKNHDANATGSKIFLYLPALTGLVLRHQA